ncbi:DUF927 domain-containing protein [Serratia fonticola]|uniref:DUF927 domain-containing protein n=1 Tax=Serratia fonticola TaxID=47917 RepID=UPI003AB0A564
MKLVEKKLNKNEQKLFVKLMANTKMLFPSDVAYRQVKVFSENSGKYILILIPSFLLASKNDVKKYLLKAGHRADMSKEYWDMAYEEVSKQTENVILLRYKPGHCGNVYLCVNDKVIGEVKGDRPVLHPSAKKHLPIEATQGTLKEWKINVAVLALYSSRILLAICSAISGTLLKILDMEGGGFHLWGTSSMGKSSSAYILASVAGAPNTIVTLWNNTDKGLEEIAVAHNDSTLILDESKLLDKDPAMTAKTITNRVYTLAGGKGKARSALYENNVAEWQLTVFSTGELSLAQHAEAGKIERLEGENVRMIDVPADAGRGMGIFESLPEGVSSSNELAHIVKDVTYRYYGSAKPAFLKHLVADIQDDREGLKAFLEKGIKYFLVQHKVNRNSGIDVRIAKRFALAYVSGCLAIKYGILPFERSDVMHGISKCYRDSLIMPCSPEPNIAEMLPKEISDILQSDDIVNIIDSDDLSENDIKQETAIICKVQKKKVLAIKKDLVHDCLTSKPRKIFLTKLTQQKILLADNEKDFSTIQIRYDGKTIDRRYCFVYDKLTDLFN